MIVKMMNNMEITVSDDQAAKIEKALQTQGSDYIKVGQHLIKKTTVMGIVPGGITEADLPDFGKKALPQGQRCVGSRSIQQEINMIAQGDGKRPTADEPGNRPWAELIRDREWRESVRMQLHASAPEDVWCDSREGTCIC